MPPLIANMQATISAVCTAGLVIFLVFAFTVGILSLVGDMADANGRG